MSQPLLTYTECKIDVIHIAPDTWQHITPRFTVSSAAVLAKNVYILYII
jgi:hypothetical protein